MRKENRKSSFITNRPRCRWCSLVNPLYVRYHDQEWGVPCHDDHALYELLILESFQAGLSWETVLNKRRRFREVYDGFDINKVCGYGEEKIAQLLTDEGIIRNRLKINASIQNSRIFRGIQEEYGSFDAYIWGWTDGKTIYENDPAVTTSPLSDAVSGDLKKRGMTFVGSTIIYAYLQAIGVINAHSDDCWLHDHHAADEQRGQLELASRHPANGRAIRRNPASPLDLTRFAQVEAASSRLPGSSQKENTILTDAAHRALRKEGGV